MLSKFRISLLLGFILFSLLGGWLFYNSQEAYVRDLRRQEDLNAIALAMEVTYNDATGQYRPLSAKQFAHGIPQDPREGNHCYEISGTSNPPTACHYCVGLYSPTCQVVSSGHPDATDRWGVCAALEKGGTYCRFSGR